MKYTSIESVKETEKQSKQAAPLSDFQSSYKGDNSPPQLKGRADPVLLAVAEEDIRERTAPPSGSGKETIVLGYFIEAQKIIGGAGSAACIARRFRLTPKKCPHSAKPRSGTVWGPRDPYGEYPATFNLLQAARELVLKKFSAGKSTLRKSFRRV